MRLGCSMYSYVKAVQAGSMDIPGFVHEAAKHGVQGVELLDFFYKDASKDRRTALAALKETGLECCVFSVANNFAQADPAKRREALDRVLFGIDEACFYGAGVVRVFAGNLPPDAAFGLDEARAWIVDCLSQASDYAHGAGVRLGLENHGKLAGKGDQVRSIVLDVRENVGHEALGANPDTGNFLLVGQTGHEGVGQVADLATMVHFKDFKPDPEGVYEATDGTRFAGTVIGEGSVDLARCVSALQYVGFEGWVNLEYEGEEDPMTGVPRSLENSRTLVN